MKKTPIEIFYKNLLAMNLNLSHLILHFPKVRKPILSGGLRPQQTETQPLFHFYRSLLCESFKNPIYFLCIRKSLQ